MADQAGDSYAEKFSPDFDNEISLNDSSRSYKFTYPSSMEVQIRKLRTSLENWKEIVLQVKNVLAWEKQWHPMALIGGSTILFTLLWLLEPSILTIASLLGLTLTIADYMIPSIVSSVFKSEKWTAKKEKEFEDVCTNLILYKAKLELTWASYYKMKVTNRKLYFVITVICLSLLAWVGCTFNNLFLAYILVSFVLLLPGLEHNGMLNKSSSFCADLLHQTRAKVDAKKD